MELRSGARGCFEGPPRRRLHTKAEPSAPVLILWQRSRTLEKCYALLAKLRVLQRSFLGSAIHEKGRRCSAVTVIEATRTSHTYIN